MRDFRVGKTGFFLTPRPGPTRAPAKNAARERIIELRRAGHSAKEIAEELAGTPTPLNRTGVAEVLAEAGFPRLPVRPPSAREAPYRDHPRRAELLDFAALPARNETKLAGLALAVPELVALDLPGLVAAAGYPSTAVIPAVNYLLSLLALKLVGIRRVSHVDDLAADAGAGLFAGLAALPKATALSTYSYRLDHTRQQALLAALGTAMLAADLIADAGGDLDLDFHAIMHWGADVALEKNYVPSRSQRTRLSTVGTLRTLEDGSQHGTDVVGIACLGDDDELAGPTSLTTNTTDGWLTRSPAEGSRRRVSPVNRSPGRPTHSSMPAARTTRLRRPPGPARTVPEPRSGRTWPRPGAAAGASASPLPMGRSSRSCPLASGGS